jgi:hypothetical protein
MEDGDAEGAVFVDVGVVERAEEAKIYEISGQPCPEKERPGTLTRRRVGVVLGEGHRGLEVTAIVQRLWIDNHQGDVPPEDVVVVELDTMSANDPSFGQVVTYLQVDPFLMGQRPVLVHQNAFGHGDSLRAPFSCVQRVCGSGDSKEESAGD